MTTWQLWVCALCMYRQCVSKRRMGSTHGTKIHMSYTIFANTHIYSYIKQNIICYKIQAYAYNITFFSLTYNKKKYKKYSISLERRKYYTHHVSTIHRYIRCNISIPRANWQLRALIPFSIAFEYTTFSIQCIVLYIQYYII